MALVTGGTRGIGAEIVRQLLEAGARVIFTGRHGTGSVESLRQELQSGAIYESIDFEDPDSTEAFARRMTEHPIDILINNAGVNTISPTEQVRLSDWDRIQQVNVRAPFVLCRALVPCMAKRGWGRVVNIASIFAEITRKERIAYSASKSALVGLTRTLALDYAGQGVLANALGPGFIDTDLTKTMLTEPQRRELCAQVPLGRLGHPREIARIVLFLASETNSFMTGQHILADGGFSIT